MTSDVPKELLEHPFRYYLSKYWRTFSIGITALFFTNLFDVLPPILIARGIDQIEAGEGSEAVLETTLILLGVLFLTAIFRYSWRVFFGRFHHSAADDLRRRVFHHFTYLGPSFFSKKPVGELMSLITNDVNMFRMGIGPGVLILFDATFMAMMTIPMMIYINPDWTWKTMIFLPLVPILIRVVMRIIYERFKVEQDAFSELSGIAQEIVSGIRVIKGYGQELIQNSKFNVKSRDYESACNATARVDALFHPVMEFGVATGAVILLYIGSSDVIGEAVTLGSFFAFFRYIQRMVWPMSAIGFGVSHVQKGLASFRRIADLLETTTDVPDHGKESIHEMSRLEVRNLTFSYPGESTPVLTDVSFTVTPGQTVGIVGPVGSGKSTLLQLLARLYPTQSGQIMVNSRPIEDYKIEQLRKVFRLVPQESFLFSETVARNISFALEDMPPMEDIRAVAEAVKIHEEVQNIPGKYEAQLGERGVNLSGGQKQRMTIARGLISQAPVLMLDDSLSAVDARTEESIQHELNTNKIHQQTRLIVSHRISSIEHADLILVLNEGQLEANGTHQELLKSSPTYRQLAEIQGRGSAEANP